MVGGTLHTAVFGTDLRRARRVASQDLHTRESPAPVFADLSKYHATTHFVGQSTILMLTDD
jgi:hypothetical protein